MVGAVQIAGEGMARSRVAGAERRGRSISCARGHGLAGLPKAFDFILQRWPVLGFLHRGRVWSDLRF